MAANPALIFDIIINVAILLVFFRFLMQLAAVSPYNPVVLSTVKATKIVDVFGRILPTVGQGRVNLAALVLLVLLYFLKMFGIKYLNAQPTGSTVYFVVSTLLAMLQSLITILKYILFAYIISSWIVMLTQSRSPYIEVLQELAEPMLAPFRKIMPNMGMIDLSPILAFFTLYIAEMMIKSIG
ncbi:YggT family protein [Acinetobacter shaoyimingii]|uniref:YggT family protein n=1 Tax=Acinetobacter shaoyimingii TaxID=2715164 RepID=A0A6G8RT40_9GAMM|nr:YggT family protein [Acinetobacter shaoyimingii]NHB56421.1 YggT family protein [Acinetobacter shaoyimingii]QIO05074.1 YggT family protein [Acinetobacter shaoyimingii]